MRMNILGLGQWSSTARLPPLACALRVGRGGRGGFAGVGGEGEHDNVEPKSPPQGCPNPIELYLGHTSGASPGPPTDSPVGGGAPSAAGGRCPPSTRVGGVSRLRVSRARYTVPVIVDCVRGVRWGGVHPRVARRPFICCSFPHCYVPFSGPRLIVVVSCWRRGGGGRGGTVTQPRPPEVRLAGAVTHPPRQPTLQLPAGRLVKQLAACA